jgi:hypothetical protein
MAHLKRVSDGEGFAGSRVEAIDPDTRKVVAYEPTLNMMLLVGSVTAGTYSGSDYWRTSPITEILERKETEDGLYIKFKTFNSIYEFWA